MENDELLQRYTTWSVVTDDPLISTTAIDTIVIDPNDYNTIYAGTGDLNFGSFSMGSQGILKSTDAGATWTVWAQTCSAWLMTDRRDNSHNTMRLVKCAWTRTTVTMWSPALNKVSTSVRRRC